MKFKPVWVAVSLLCSALVVCAEDAPAKPNEPVPAKPDEGGPATTAGVNPAKQDAGVLAEIGGQPVVYEVIRHLYRWYLNEADIERNIVKPTVSVWLRQLHPQLDPGDRSGFVELVLPTLQVKVTLKKTDYRIEELNLDVKGRGYRMINVSREAAPATSEGYQALEFELPALVEYLFKTRNQREFPDPALQDRMYKAVLLELGDRRIPSVGGIHICHVGPMSSVSNELWVFWENGRMLIRFTSDMDLSNPAVWSQENLKVRTFDIDRQVVVSQSEVSGSNAFLNREQERRSTAASSSCPLSPPQFPCPFNRQPQPKKHTR
jgi:hypothetical protein